MSSAAEPSPVGDLPSLGDSHRHLREQVADLIRERIIAGELRPGTRLVERTLAESLGVSRVPVRDALSQLKGEGLISQLPRSGMVVTELTRQMVEELLDVREALEVLSVRQATQRATPSEIKRLRKLLDTAATALQREDLKAFNRTNSLLHDLITQMARNDLLASLIQPLQGRLHWLLRQNGDPRLVHAQHVAVCEAIAAGDPHRAEQVALEHVQTSRDLALSSLSFGDDED